VVNRDLFRVDPKWFLFNYSGEVTPYILSFFFSRHLEKLSYNIVELVIRLIGIQIHS
jgi:hypothetical protein